MAEGFLSSHDIDSLFISNYTKIENSIYRPHISILAQQPANLASEILDASGYNIALLDHLLNSRQKIKSFDPLMVAFSVTAALENPEYQRHILRSQAMKNGPQFLAKMREKSLKMANMRILGTNGYELLGISDFGPQAELAALSVRPYSIQERALIPTEVQGFIRTLSIFAKMGRPGWDMIRAIATESEAFYAAFGIRDLEAQLTEIESPIAREKTWLANALPELVRGFRVVLLDAITQNAGADAATQMDLEINWGRLGLVENK